MKTKVLVKVCDICSREFETLFESKKHCSLECVNEKGRQYQRAKNDRLKELEEENKELKKQLQLAIGPVKKSYNEAFEGREEQ